jgi:hypothetical protein
MLCDKQYSKLVEELVMELTKTITKSFKEFKNILLNAHQNLEKNSLKTD